MDGNREATRAFDSKNAMENRIKQIIEESSHATWDENSKRFIIEIYADYRDEASYEQIVKWCDAENSRDAFYDELSNWYAESYFDCVDELYDVVEQNWGTEIVWFDESEEYIKNWIREHIVIALPGDHYLKQKVCVNIFLDTGDANYDFVLNSIYPHYNGIYGDPIPEKASVLWLARQQGYNKRQMNKTMRHGEYGGSVFLKSLRSEIVNCSTHMNALVFFVEMSLDELLTLQEELRAEKNAAYRGQKSILIDKSAVCGLYDAWNGGGSILEIKLEKDVSIPYKYIDTALPDGSRGYSVRECYGVSNALWTPRVKKIA